MTLGAGFNAGSAYVDVLPELKGFQDKVAREVDAATKKASERAQKAIDVGNKLTLGVTLPVAAGLTKAFDAASDLNEAVNVTGLVFKDARGEMDEFAEDSVDKLGLSERAAREMTATVGGLLNNLGFAQDETVQWSQKLAVLSADMGSAFNRSTEDAVHAIGAALRGETEPIRQFNVMLDDAAVRAKAVEMGLAATTAEVDKHGKAQASLALIMEQTTDVQGDWAATSDQAAGSLKKAKAEAENAAAALGESLLPAGTKALQMAADLAAGFAALPEPVQNAALGLAGVAAAAGPVLSIGGRLYQTWTKVERAFAGSTLKTLPRDLGAMTRGIGAAGPIGIAAAAGIGVFVKALSDAQDHANELRIELEGLAAADDDLFLAAFARSMDQFRDESAGFFNTVNDFLGSFTGGEARRKAESIRAALEAAVRVGPEATQAFLDFAEAEGHVRVEADGTVVALGYASERVAFTADEIDRMAQSAEDAAKAGGSTLRGGLDAAGDGMAFLADETGEAIDSLQKYVDMVRAQFDPMFRLNQALQDYEAAQAASNETRDEYGHGSPQHQQALFDETQALLGLESAAASGQLSFEAFERQLGRWVEQGRYTKSEADAIRERVRLLTEQSGEYSGNYQANFYADTSQAIEGVGELLTVLKTIENREWRAKVALDYDTRAREAVIGGAAAAVSRNAPGGVRPHNAHGGEVLADELGFVGETGMETFVPAVDGRILSHRDSVNALREAIREGLRGLVVGSDGARMVVEEGAFQIVARDTKAAAAEGIHQLRRLALEVG